MRTLNSLGQRDSQRMARILKALQSREWVRSDALAEIGGVARLHLAGFIKILRGEGFVIEHMRRYCSFERTVWRSYYKMTEETKQ